MGLGMYSPTSEFTFRIMAGVPCSTMRVPKAQMPLSCPNTLTRNTSSNASGEDSTTRAGTPGRPALLTSTSTRPNSSQA